MNQIKRYSNYLEETNKKRKNKMNPIKVLFDSRKFLLLIFDVVSSLAIYFVGKYAGAAVEDLKFVIMVIQPLWILVVGAIAAQNVAGIKAKADIEEAALYNENRAKEKPVIATNTIGV